MGIRREFNKEVEVKREVTSIGDLTRRCNEAVARMSANNPHRQLILDCAFAMQQLVQRLDRLENPTGRVQ